MPRDASLSASRDYKYQQLHVSNTESFFYIIHDFGSDLKYMETQAIDYDSHMSSLYLQNK